MSNKFTSLILCASMIVLLGSAAGAAPKIAVGAKAGAFRPVLPEGKRMAPVDVAYRVIGPLTPGQPAVIELSLTPRLAASALELEVAPTIAYRIERSNAPIALGKVGAGMALRHSLTVTPVAGTPQDMRILVSVDVPGARYASVFRIPLSNTAVDPRRLKRH
jgi:hypothetical protein